MNLLQLVDKHLESPHRAREFSPPRGHHPSAASCIIKDDSGENMVAGKCLKAVYWRSTGVPKTNPMNARSIRICSVGKLVEAREIASYKEMGIWRDNNVKFFNPEHCISGEVDAIVMDNVAKQDTGVEIKTGYDYYFRKTVLGTKYKKGTPKLDHLLQTMLYVDYFKIPFKIVYIDRGNAQRGEFNLTLNADGTPNIDGKKITTGLSIPNCVARYKETEEAIARGVAPPRDYFLKYPKERIEQLYLAGSLNKGQTKEFEKNKDVDMGDWQCSYCDYKDHCWSNPEVSS